MAEYIEREALLNLKEEMWQDRCDHMVVRVTNIMNVPAADVVEVVRCKDCRHWHKTFGGSLLLKEHGYCRLEDADGIETSRWEDDFCSYGERKEPDV